ncbi:MAG: hypothetical protein QXS81_01000 [Candidatus Micrarchaeaceae archaeon]
MTNTYMISLPDELKPIADQLTSERRLSSVIAELLKRWYDQQQQNQKAKNGYNR